MTVWDGRGMPPAVAARLARHARNPMATGYTTPGGLAGLTAAELDVVGEVFGTCTLSTGGIANYVYCSSDGTPVVRGLAGEADYSYSWMALYEYGYATALRRLLAEARGLRADGVIGVTVAGSPEFVAPGRQSRAATEPSSNWTGPGPEFTASGTAVRWRNPALRGSQPFLTSLQAPGVVTLLAARWIPVDLVISLAQGVVHLPFGARYRQSHLGRTEEMAGPSRLLGAVGAEARRGAMLQVARSGRGLGCLTSAIELDRVQAECLAGTGGRDEVVTARLVGDVITSVADQYGSDRHGIGAPRLTMSMLPTRRREDRMVP